MHLPRVRNGGRLWPRDAASTFLKQPRGSGGALGSREPNSQPPRLVPLAEALHLREARRLPRQTTSWVHEIRKLSPIA